MFSEFDEIHNLQQDMFLQNSGLSDNHEER